MTKREAEKMFTQYSPMLHQLSHQCARRCGRPEEDTFGQACWLFMRAASTWRAGRGTEFGTYARTVVRNGLADWGRKQDLPPDPENVPEAMTRLTPYHHAEAHDWLAGLSVEAREVAAIVLNGPAEALGIEFAGTVGVLRAIREHLHRDRGWTWRRTWAALRELRVAVRARA